MSLWTNFSWSCFEVGPQNNLNRLMIDSPIFLAIEGQHERFHKRLGKDAIVGVCKIFLLTSLLHFMACATV